MTRPAPGPQHGVIMSRSPAGPRQAGLRSPAGARLTLMSRAALRWLVFRDVHARDRSRRRTSGPGEPGSGGPSHTLPL